MEQVAGEEEEVLQVLLEWMGLKWMLSRMLTALLAIGVPADDDGGLRFASKDRSRSAPHHRRRRRGGMREVSTRNLESRGKQKDTRWKVDC